MKKMVNIIQIILVLVVWYCFYSTGGWKSIGFGGEKKDIVLLMLLYVLPMILIGIALNIFSLASNLKNKQSVQKINILMEVIFLAVLIVVPIIMAQKIPSYDMFSEEMLSEIYLKMDFRSIFGMGMYMATALCAGHMIGALSQKPKEVIIKYISVILIWFLSYDVLLPMTETMARSGRNYTFETLLMVITMLLSGIILAYNVKNKSERHHVNRLNLILMIVLIAVAAIVPISVILIDLGVPIYESQNVVSEISGFIRGSMLYIILWLCVGDFATKLKEPEAKSVNK